MFTKANVLSLFLVLTAFSVSSQTPYFSDVSESSLKTIDTKRVIVPQHYRTLQLDLNGLQQYLENAPNESQLINRNTAPILELPMPNGTVAAFRIWKSVQMEAGLAAQFPNIQTFTGQGITDPTAILKADITELGFHAMVLSDVNGSVFVDPYAQGTTSAYISYRKADFRKSGIYTELPPIPSTGGMRPAGTSNILAGVCVGTQLRTYRLAVACTGEYAVAATGFPTPTVGQTLSAITTSVNRVSGVYEKEVAVRLVLVATENNVIFTNAATDPFTGNNNAGTLIGESQTVIDDRIGNANYDIGHTFSTGGGGLAQLGCVCQTGNKANGITGSGNPVGDPYDIDYVAHEIGHQFGGNHTFNSITGSCGGNGANNANAEPGSGTTIMAYAGICGSDDLQSNSDPQFQAISFNEITTYITPGGFGNTCATLTNTGNQVPVVNAGTDYTIPKFTPFILTGSATDGNGDALSYSWEQINTGGTFGAWNAPVGDAPIFRSFPPVATPTRFFPKLSDVINNTTTIGEILPSYARVMSFRLTARDNRAGGSGVCFDENGVTVANNAGPFTVTFPTATGVIWSVGDFQTVTWDVSGTTAAPVSCANVAIQLSTDGGNTFPITLAASTANDGSEEIIVPNNVTTTARIRVIAVGNVFYDMSNNNFRINASAAGFAFNNPANVPACSASSGSTTLLTNPIGGFSTAINLAASGVPAGTTVTFGTNPVTPGNSTTVTLNNTNTLAAGTYTITITGTAGAVVKTRSISFVVGTAASAPASLTTPANNAIGVAVSPTFNWSPVSGASGYSLEVADNNSFSPILQTITGNTTLPYSLLNPLSENTVYYWRVKTTNACGTGSASTTSIFKTAVIACTTFASTNIPVVISPSGTPTITSTITIPGASGVTISDLNVVGVNITHSYIGDLSLSLTSPAATTVALVNAVCDSDNDMALNFDDEASVAVVPCPPTGDVTVTPAAALTAFDGQSSTGTWTLTVADGADADGGNLTGWGLSICRLTATPIPVTWLRFTGVKQDNTSSLLSWSVNEYNNHHYDIERSVDGIRFTAIGTLNASSNGAGNQRDYYFTDIRPLVGKNYYRLKQVDVDGRFTYSNTIVLLFTQTKGGYAVYPNPTRNQFQVVSGVQAKQVQLQLFDAAGKMMLQQQFEQVAVGQVLNVNVARLAKGMYTLQIGNGDQVQTQKLVIQ